MLQVFVRNFISFDFLIFVLAIFNAGIFLRSLRLTRKLRKVLNPKGYLPGGWHDYRKISAYYHKYLKPEGEQELLERYRKVLSSYSLFENISAIFPLLGILGTVISLIPMVNNIGEIETNLFFAALTSTFWGIVFAIIYKSGNGLLQAEIEILSDQVNLYVDRNTRLLVKASEIEIKQEMEKKSDSTTENTITKVSTDIDPEKELV